MVRFHAIGLIPDTCPVVKSNNNGYGADTEQEMVIETEGDNEDNEETLKKKKKGNKPKVWDLIKAQQCQNDDLAIPKTQEDMEVSVMLLESESIPYVLV